MTPKIKVISVLLFLVIAVGIVLLLSWKIFIYNSYDPHKEITHKSYAERIVLSFDKPSSIPHKNITERRLISIDYKSKGACVEYLDGKKWVPVCAKEGQMSDAGYFEKVLPESVTLLVTWSTWEGK